MNPLKLLPEQMTEPATHNFPLKYFGKHESEAKNKKLHPIEVTTPNVIVIDVMFVAAEESSKPEPRKIPPMEIIIPAPNFVEKCEEIVPNMKQTPNPMDPTQAKE